MEDDWTYAGERGKHRDSEKRLTKEKNRRWWDHRVSSTIVGTAGHFIAAPQEVQEVVDMLGRNDSVPEREMTIEEAIIYLGPIRSGWVTKDKDPEKPVWLDGRHATIKEVIDAAKTVRARKTLR